MFVKVLGNTWKMWVFGGGEEARERVDRPANDFDVAGMYGRCFRCKRTGACCDLITYSLAPL